MSMLISDYSYVYYCKQKNVGSLIFFFLKRKIKNTGRNIGTPKNKNEQQKSIKFTKENL
jgi:hypothetical protein